MEFGLLTNIRMIKSNMIKIPLRCLGKERTIMKISTFLTDRFETVEALAVVDVLRRAGMDVELVSITGSLEVTSAQNVKIIADCLLEECDLAATDVMFLPGGPGHKAYMQCTQLLDELKRFNEKGKLIAAICAAPSVLGKIGLLNGKKATCFPGFEDSLIGADVQTAPVKVVTDGNVVTARGMGASTELGLELVRILEGEEAAHDLGISLQYYEQD